MSDLKITNVVFSPRMAEDDSFIGFARIFFNDAFFIDSIAVHITPEKDEGLSLTFPAKRLRNGDFKYYARPVSKELADRIKKSIKDHLEEIDYFKA